MTPAMTIVRQPALASSPQLPGIATPQRISVKSRIFKAGPAYVSYMEHNSFDWAIVLQPGGTETWRRIFLVPRAHADAKARRPPQRRSYANPRSHRLRNRLQHLGLARLRGACRHQGDAARHHGRRVVKQGPSNPSNLVTAAGDAAADRERAPALWNPGRAFLAFRQRG